MLPSSTGGGRKDRDIKKLKQDARSTEIQRLIGRSLRAAVDMAKLGERLMKGEERKTNLFKGKEK